MRRLLLHVVVAAWAAGAWGCAGSQRMSDAARAQTYSVRPPQAVFDSQAMREARARGVARGQLASPGQAGRPWWASRNDGRLNVRPGAATVPARSSVTVTRDRQQSFGDRIHNVYRRVETSVEIAP